MKAAPLPKRTIEEYQEQEQTSGVKYEYHDGAIHALAGGTLNHGKLCGNFYAELRQALKEKNSSCKVFTSEIKLCIQQENTFVYPAVQVICGEVQTAELDENAVTNPILLIEVLSKSTAEYDRGDKFFLYRQLPTLQEYVLVEQDKAVIETYYKKPHTDLWNITRFTGLGSTLKLRSLNLEIPLAALYFDIDLA